MNRSNKVLFLVPYPVHKAPSQRFRIELFLPELEQRHITYRIVPFLNARTWDVLYKKASIFQKILGVTIGFLRRVITVLFTVPVYDYVVVHREASPLGPPVFEFIIARLWRKKLIYDFDDAIWIPNTSQENGLVSWVKAFWKVKCICRWAYKVVAGNQYLYTYARQYNTSVVLLPTCVDMVRQHNKVKDQYTSRPALGWTGSHSTMGFLKSIVPVLEKVISETGASFILISNKPPDFSIPNLIYIPWQEVTEIKDLLRINIGVMPLKKDPWCEGKCGFKIIQYLSLGIPAVASSVGVNRQIIDEGKNGFLCSTEAQWYVALKKLLTDPELRNAMGKAGRAKIRHTYSVQATVETFLGLFV